MYLFQFFIINLKTKHLITAHPAMPIGSTYKFETVNLAFPLLSYHLIYSDVVYFGNLMDRADKAYIESPAARKKWLSVCCRHKCTGFDRFSMMFVLIRNRL